MSKAISILNDMAELVDAMEDYLEKQEKAEQWKTSKIKHEATIARRKVKTLVAKFRLTNPKPAKKQFTQGGMNFFLAL